MFQTPPFEAEIRNPNIEILNKHEISNDKNSKHLATFVWDFESFSNFMFV